VVIPISDWEKIIETHQDINLMLQAQKETPKKNNEDFRGCISDETAKALHEHVLQSRNEWEERLNKQF
jgi:hypothetical protein